MTLSLIIPYMFLIFASTVINRRTRLDAVMDLRLLGSLQRDNWRQMVANAVMFLPIGFLIPVALRLRKRGKGYKRAIKAVSESILTICTGIFFSITVEGSQYYFRKGVCEAGDVIMNSVGTITGLLLYLIYSYLIEDRIKTARWFICIRDNIKERIQE